MGANCCGRTKSPKDSTVDGESRASTSADNHAHIPQIPTPPHKQFQEIAGVKPTPAEGQVHAGILLAGKTKEAVAGVKSTGAEDQIHTGISLPEKPKKYLVDDEKTKRNHIMLVPRELSITWSEDPKHWTWRPLKDASGAEVETASLKQVAWLDIRGKQELSHLTPGVTYEVFFEVMLSESSEGWGVPVKLEIKFPSGTILQCEEELQKKPWAQWLELKAGEVTAYKDLKGEMEISMFEHGTHLKTGLVIKGIKIVPKASRAWDALEDALENQPNSYF